MADYQRGQHNALLIAAKQVIWKLNHNFITPDYTGPARITRQDATIRLLVAAVEAIEEANNG